MINRIKDKQTGEYHDIGGLKCKLVAEGTLEWNEEYELLRPIYNFEENKYYLVMLFSQGLIALQGAGVYIDGELSTPLSYNSIADAYLGMFITNDFVTIQDITIDNKSQQYENFTYKVYELPFALEV